MSAPVRHSLLALVLTLIVARQLNAAADLPVCGQATKRNAPCELSFELQKADLPGQPPSTPYLNELLTVEFRNLHAGTFLVHPFAVGPLKLKIRFSAMEEGDWSYRVSSSIKRLDGQSGQFNAAASDRTAFVTPANLRHWQSGDRHPHLWLSAEAPLLKLSQSEFEQWATARKQDGFTRIRGVLLQKQSALNPFTASGDPDDRYFAELDQRLLFADSLDLAVDLVIANTEMADGPWMATHEAREPMIRYLTARYSALNASWQGFQSFEQIKGARAILRDLGDLLAKYDSFRHPRSTDAMLSAAPLLPDKWLNFVVESAPGPDLAAVEHQFIRVPMIHVVTATEPAAFRSELWNSTANGSYPTISYAATTNAADLAAVKTWQKAMSGTRHWELEPYFDVDNARATGLDEVEFVAYAPKPGIVEVTLHKHKYNPVWINPAGGQEVPVEDFKGEVFSQSTPDNAHDWVLLLPRDGKKESMLKSYKFVSQGSTEQEPEVDTTHIPFTIEQPSSAELHLGQPISFKAKLRRPNRSTRTMQYVWLGEIPGSEDGERILATGDAGQFTIAKDIAGADKASAFHLRLLAINAFGKAFVLDKVYQLVP